MAFSGALIRAREGEGERMRERERETKRKREDDRGLFGARRAGGGEGDEEERREGGIWRENERERGIGGNSGEGAPVPREAAFAPPPIKRPGGQIERNRGRERGGRGGEGVIGRGEE